MRFASFPLLAFSLGCCDAPGRTADIELQAQNRPDSVTVPGGTYAIGRETGPASQRPAHRVAIEPFSIDRTEVTNAAFTAFLNALRLPVHGSFDRGGIGTQHADRATLGLLTTSAGRRGASFIELDDGDAEIVLAAGRFLPAPGRADHPATEVTWHGARAFCAWRKGALPTEAQWEAAARGLDDRRFPWGNDAPSRDRVVRGGAIGRTEPAGSRPSGASPSGALDMAGNLAEWTSSLKRPYPYRADDGRENPDAAGERTTRGGDYEYDDDQQNFTVSFRDGFSNDPAHGHRHVGFRCAYPMR